MREEDSDGEQAFENGDALFFIGVGGIHRGEKRFESIFAPRAVDGDRGFVRVDAAEEHIDIGDGERAALPVTGGAGIGAGEAIERVLPEALPALISGGLAGSVGLGVALALGWALRVREVREVIGLVSGKVARRLKRR